MIAYWASGETAPEVRGLAAMRAAIAAGAVVAGGSGPARPYPLRVGTRWTGRAPETTNPCRADLWQCGQLHHCLQPRSLFDEVIAFPVSAATGSLTGAPLPAQPRRDPSRRTLVTRMSRFPAQVSSRSQAQAGHTLPWVAG